MLNKILYSQNADAVFLIVLFWLIGIVFAKGVWSTIVSVIFAPYAWYLVMEKLAITAGWI